MQWIPFETEKTLASVIEKSFQNPQVIFKHSTRCSISAMALNRLEAGKSIEGVDFYYLDLLKFRDISNKIANYFDVNHESPQILLIRNGKCVFHASHSDIRMNALQKEII